MKAAFISGGYLGLIAQVVIAAVNFTFVDRNSLLWQCLTLVLVTGRFDGTRCNKTFRGTVSHVSIKKSFATGVLIRRTSRFYLVGGTVSPTLRWHTLVALETISCMKKKGRKIEREREKKRFLRKSSARSTFCESSSNAHVPRVADIPAFDLWYKLQAVRYFSVSRDEAWQDLASVTGVWKKSSLRAVSHPNSLSFLLNTCHSGLAGLEKANKPRRLPRATILRYCSVQANLFYIFFASLTYTFHSLNIERTWQFQSSVEIWARHTE